MSQKSETAIIDSQLRSLGAFVPLQITFDQGDIDSILSDCAELWQPYNKKKVGYKRYGVSLYSLDGGVDGEIDLNSIGEYNQKHQTKYTEMSFRTPTPYWSRFTGLSEPLKEFAPHLGRSHLLRLDKGGFFPPHRDLGNSFRLISFFDCEPWELYFVIEDKKYNFQPNRLYYVDTRRAHTVFSFRNDATCLVLNVDISEPAYRLVLQNLREF